MQRGSREHGPNFHAPNGEHLRGVFQGWPYAIVRILRCASWSQLRSTGALQHGHIHGNATPVPEDHERAADNSGLAMEGGTQCMLVVGQGSPEARRLFTAAGQQPASRKKNPLDDRSLRGGPDLTGGGRGGRRGKRCCLLIRVLVVGQASTVGSARRSPPGSRRFQTSQRWLPSSNQSSHEAGESPSLWTNRVWILFVHAPS